jgi:hypothetical protein
MSERPTADANLTRLHVRLAETAGVPRNTHWPYTIVVAMSLMVKPESVEKQHVYNIAQCW